MTRLLIILLILPIFTKAQIITTFAGTGVSGHTGDGGPATAAEIPYFNGGKFDRYGNYFFPEITGGDRIRKISTLGIITTVAGSGIHGFSGDGGPATAASLNTPTAVALDTLGNIYIADIENERIRKVDFATGIISTIAGNGTGGYSGDGGQATDAMIYAPEDICTDKSGNIYIADYFNSRVRKVNTSGIISTVAGTDINGYNGDNGLADTSQLNGPLGVCTDDSGNLYIADNSNLRVRKVDAHGIITTVAGNGIYASSGDGGNAMSAGILPYYVHKDKLGNLYICETKTVANGYGGRIRKVNNAGIIVTVAGTGIAGYNGDGGLADTANLNNPCGISTDSCGNLYIGDDYNHRIRKITYPYCGYLEIPEIKKTTMLSIYPNPTSSSVIISSTNNIGNVTILNLFGQTVYTDDCHSEKAELDISKLTPGVYFIKINNTDIRKVVKE